MKKWRLFFKIVFFIFISIFIFNIGMYVYAYITPKTALNSANRIAYYDKDDNLIYSNLEKNKWVSIDKISPHLKKATIATEDKNFYSHKGFDYLRIISAFFSNIKKGNLNQGASTISQQYIKNLYLDFDKNIKRKLEEAYLTFELETHYSKDEILEGYLNTINYGGGNFGIENASLYYFNKNAKDLNLAEATLIAGIPKNPSLYNPKTHYKNAKKRQKIVLKSMVNNKYISKNKAKKIFKEEIKLSDSYKDEETKNSNYYTDAVLTELQSISEIPKSLSKTNGLKIYTNYDDSIQKKAENNIKLFNNVEDLQTAMLIIEPKTGKVLSLIGGKNYKLSEYNRVTQSKRQVGSTIKPFLYYSALENGMTAISTFSSEKTTFTVDKNKIYSPKNYNDKYPNKNITMAAAIAYSDNIYAVKTHMFLGNNILKNTLINVGVKTNINETPSLALGTSEISMLDYSNAYITLANNGVHNEPYLIRKITDSENNIIYEHKSESNQVLDKNYVFIINDLLTKTYNSKYTDYTNPTMISIKNKLTKKYAVKSGSTDNDFWTIGYNPDMLVMVWTGKDNNEKLNSSWSSISKNIWSSTIEQVLNTKQNTWYNIPKNIIATNVNPITGDIDGKKEDTLFFLKGTEPKKNS